MTTEYADIWGSFLTRAGTPALAWLPAPAHQWASFEIRRMIEDEDYDRAVECIEGVVPDAWGVYACDEFSGLSAWVSDFRSAHWAHDAIARLSGQLYVVRRLQGLSTGALEPPHDL